MFRLAAVVGDAARQPQSPSRHAQAGIEEVELLEFGIDEFAETDHSSYVGREKRTGAIADP
ncbi:MAG: hypothetical protein IPK93_09235 [Solirubrobacterales bacterium]|nr:hypothetical protein [Solirubrobacterales bacterium]